MTRTLIKVTLSPASLARVEAARSTLAHPGLPPLSRSEAVAVLVERGLAVTEGPTRPVEENPPPPVPDVGGEMPPGWEPHYSYDRWAWFRDPVAGDRLMVSNDWDGRGWYWSMLAEAYDAHPYHYGCRTGVEAMRAADAAWAKHQEVDRG